MQDRLPGAMRAINEQQQRAIGVIGAGTERADCAKASGASCGEQVTQATDGDYIPHIHATVSVRANNPFEIALSAAKAGARITRAGWNAGGQHVEQQVPTKQSRMTLPYLVLRNSSGELVPWVPSQGDLFARDWAVLPS